MQKAALTRTPIYSSAPLNTPSPSGSKAASPVMGNASLATTATGTTGPASWESLRKEVRQVELEIESKLTALSKTVVQTGSGRPGAGVGAGQGSSSSAGAAESPEELENNIEGLLEKVGGYCHFVAVTLSSLHGGAAEPSANLLTWRCIIGQTKRYITPLAEPSRGCNVRTHRHTDTDQRPGALDDGTSPPEAS